MTNPKKPDPLTDSLVVLFAEDPTAEEQARIDRMTKASKMSMAQALDYEPGEG